jgi:hypothetical protein
LTELVLSSSHLPFTDTAIAALATAISQIIYRNCDWKCNGYTGYSGVAP